MINFQTGSQARTSFVNSGSAIRICRWSPDGTKIATAGDDEKTILWDLDCMEELGFVTHGFFTVLFYFDFDCLFLLSFFKLIYAKILLLWIDSFCVFCWVHVQHWHISTQFMSFSQLNNFWLFDFAVTQFSRS